MGQIMPTLPPRSTIWLGSTRHRASISRLSRFLHERWISASANLAMTTPVPLFCSPTSHVSTISLENMLELSRC